MVVVDEARPVGLRDPARVPSRQRPGGRGQRRPAAAQAATGGQADQFGRQVVAVTEHAFQQVGERTAGVNGEGRSVGRRYAGFRDGQVDAALPAVGAKKRCGQPARRAFDRKLPHAARGQRPRQQPAVSRPAVQDERVGLAGVRGQDGDLRTAYRQQHPIGRRVQPAAKPGRAGPARPPQAHAVVVERQRAEPRIVNGRCRLTGIDGRRRRNQALIEHEPTTHAPDARGLQRFDEAPQVGRR